MIVYRVKHRAVGQMGAPDGTFSFWTDRRERAEQIAAEGPGRSIEETPEEQVPPEVLANLKRAAAAQG